MAERDDIPAAAAAQRVTEANAYLADLLLIAGDFAEQAGGLLREAGRLLLPPKGEQ